MQSVPDLMKSTSYGGGRTMYSALGSGYGEELEDLGVALVGSRGSQVRGTGGLHTPSSDQSLIPTGASPLKLNKDARHQAPRI